MTKHAEDLAKLGWQYFECPACGSEGSRAFPKPEQEPQAYREAAQLAKWLFKKHYAQEEHYASGRVVWGLCDTTAGVISQIDNMVCKLVLPKEPEQEPVGEVGQIDIDEDGVGYAWFTIATDGLELGDKLYTTPPQRTWVGLTDGEVDKMILLMGFPPDWITENAIVKNIVRNLEAKLKEKNSG